MMLISEICRISQVLTSRRQLHRWIAEHVTPHLYNDTPRGKEAMTGCLVFWLDDVRGRRDKVPRASIYPICRRAKLWGTSIPNSFNCSGPVPHQCMPLVRDSWHVMDDLRMIIGPLQGAQLRKVNDDKGGYLHGLGERQVKRTGCLSRMDLIAR